MKHLRSLITLASLLITSFAFFNGCKDPNSVEPYSGSNADSKTFMKIADNSPSVNSFTPNYNEEEAMALAG